MSRFCTLITFLVLVISAGVLAQDEKSSIKTLEGKTAKTVSDQAPAPISPAPSDGKYVLWTPDSPLGRLIGARVWWLDPDTHWMYVAVSPAELRGNVDLLYDGPKDSAWQSAFTDGFIKSVWTSTAKYPEPTYVLRADRFEELRAAIEKVHGGKLPWNVTRTDVDDPKGG